MDPDTAEFIDMVEVITAITVTMEVIMVTVEVMASINLDTEEVVVFSAVVVIEVHYSETMLMNWRHHKAMNRTISRSNSIK